MTESGGFAESLKNYFILSVQLLLVLILFFLSSLAYIDR